MSAEQYVMLANVLVWLAVGLYVAFLGRAAGEISRRLTQLELLSGREGGHDA